MTKRVLILAAVAALASVSTLRAQQPADAASTYAKKCASCHGTAGAPSAAMARSMKIPDFAAAATLASVSDSVLKSVVSAGKGMMPSYKTQFTPAQIASLVTYIRTFSRH